MRTPEPPDRDEHGDSPPRLSRPKRTTRPPNNYSREQENDNEQRKMRSQQKNITQIGPEAQRDATTSDDSSTESEDLSTANLVEELVKLREKIRRRDELHREELQKVQEEFRKAKDEFGAALVPAPGMPSAPSFDETNATEFLERMREMCSRSTIHGDEMMMTLMRYSRQYVESLVRIDRTVDDNNRAYFDEVDDITDVLVTRGEFGDPERAELLIRGLPQKWKVKIINHHSSKDLPIHRQITYFEAYSQVKRYSREQTNLRRYLAKPEPLGMPKKLQPEVSQQLSPHQSSHQTYSDFTDA